MRLEQFQKTIERIKNRKKNWNDPDNAITKIS